MVNIRLMPVPYISSRRSNRVVSNVLGGMSNGFPASLSEMRDIGRFLRLSDSDSDCTGGEGLSSLPVSFFVGFEAELVVLLEGVFFFSPMDRIVGGSCIGSPARISFFALKMGTQQTWWWIRFCVKIFFFSYSPLRWPVLPRL